MVGFYEVLMKKVLLVSLAVLTALLLAQEPEPARGGGDPAFRGMRYRLIGPFRGGRSLAVSGIPGDTNTYYFGAAGGGVWKSTDGAVSWAPIFDRESAFSIGALAVSTADPNVI